MKYRFLKKGKTLSSAQIKAHMDFEKVLEESATMMEGSLPQSSFLKEDSQLKWLWLLIIPAAIGVYFFLQPASNKAPEQTPGQKEILAPQQKQLLTKDSTSENEVLPQAKDSAIPAEESLEKNTTKLEEETQETSTPIETETKENGLFSNEVVKEDVFIKAVPKMGFDQFYAFIDRELKYPDTVTSNILEGYVKILFWVNPDGSLSDFEIKESLGKVFDEEALRVLQLVKEWTPATFNDEAVKSQLSIKMKFKLENH